MELFITCNAHLESLLRQELEELGYTDVREGFRGVNCRVDSLKDVYRINYLSRIASRVLLPLKEFQCRGPEELYRAARSIQWEPYFKKAEHFAIDANVDHPQIRNSLYAAQVVKDAICDQLVEKMGRRPNVQTYRPDLQLNLFIRGGKGTLSFDTSGDPLHKRGYRQESSEAPLQETLGAALLKLSHYNPEEIMIDPCMGSGTLLIEAAMVATKTPAGFFRSKYGFQHHPEFDSTEWLKIRNEADNQKIPLKKGHLFGLDVNKNAVRIAQANLRASGFNKEVEITQGDFRDFEPKTVPNYLLTNPPYGKRLEESTMLAPLYRALGQFMKSKMQKPARGFVLCGSMDLTKEVGLASSKRTVLDNGGIEARLLEFDLY
jgi:putative N6-adenine-specific DNA methylase